MISINRLTYSLFLAGLLIILFSCSEQSDREKIVENWKTGNISGNLKIAYPAEGTVFPPESTSPTFFWHDLTKTADSWLLLLEAGGKIEYISVILHKEYFKPDSVDWERLKSIKSNRGIIARVLGFKKDNPYKVLSSDAVNISISSDSVGAPIFFRSVTLPFGFAVEHLGTICWRLGNISSYRIPPVVMENLPVCGNCHTFSRDGKILAMDIDYGNDKGSYIITAVNKKMTFSPDKIITWSEYRRKDGELTFGLLSQISPDGRYAISTVKDRSIFVRKDDIYFSQLFFPIKGILVVYDRETKKFFPLPGACDKKYVQSNPVWSPDGKYILFAKTNYYYLEEAEKSKAAVLPTSFAAEFIEGRKDFKYDIYKIPFNDGKGGTAEPLPGASGNGKSNFFPRFSPDGKWLVFTLAKNFMLLQPDSKLYIMPASGGTPRLMNCNTQKMNSWHSWSPNGKWLVFSSKARGPYTQLYLTHIDKNGDDSPAVLLENFIVTERAANIPEFVNMPSDGIEKITEKFMENDYFLLTKGKEKLYAKDFTGAVADLNKAIELNPDNFDTYVLRGITLIELGKNQEAIADFTKAIKLNPKSFYGYANRASVKFKLGDYKDAIEDYSMSLSLFPEDPKVLYSRASAKYNISNYRGAIEDYTKAISFDDSNPQFFLERGMAKMQLGQIDSACEDFHKANEMGNTEALDYIKQYCK